MEALRYCKQQYKLVILSNVDRASFRGACLGWGWRSMRCYTAEDIGSYKPDPRNFAYLLARLGGAWAWREQDILHVAQSLFHDHAPANAAGFASAWIDRRQDAGWGATVPPPDGVRWDWRFPTLGAMASAVEGVREGAGRKVSLPLPGGRRRCGFAGSASEQRPPAPNASRRGRARNKAAWLNHPTESQTSPRTRPAPPR